MDLIKKTQGLLDYFSWVGIDPPSHGNDRKRMETFIHPEFLITYNGRIIICGIQNLGTHFMDAYREVGHWHIEKHDFSLLGKIRCIAKYDVVTERKGKVSCQVIYEYLNDLAVGQHEFMAYDLSEIINTHDWTHI